MELDQKIIIKSEPVDPYEEEIKPTPTNHSTQNGLDPDVAAEYNVVLLRPSENANICRLLFNQCNLQDMDSCTSRMKRQVKHLELNYQAPRNNRGEAINETAALFDGIYNGENVDNGEELLRHAVGFFKGGRLYMLPIEESYELQRKIAKRKTDKNGNSEEEFVGKGKIDDSKLLEIDATPSANPVRVAFARNETEWQKKRREQSAQHKQQLIDSDPWITMDINKLSVRKAFEHKVKKSEENMPAKMDKEHKLPVI